MTDEQVPYLEPGARAERIAALEAELAALHLQSNPPQLFPAARYHATLGSRLVKDEEEDAALGEGWSDAVPDAAPAVYPAYRYHASKDPLLVKDAAADAALGEGWYPTVQLAAASK